MGGFIICDIMPPDSRTVYLTTDDHTEIGNWKRQMLTATQEGCMEGLQYTRYWDQIINHQLRQGKDGVPRLSVQSARVHQNLLDMFRRVKDHPIPVGTILYRGIKNLDIKVGETIINEGWSSFSLHKDKARDFGKIILSYEVKEPQTSIYFGKLGLFGNEEEVLLKPGLRLRVKTIDSDEWTTDVTVTFDGYMEDKGYTIDETIDTRYNEFIQRVKGWLLSWIFPFRSDRCPKYVWFSPGKFHPYLQQSVRYFDDKLATDYLQPIDILSNENNQRLYREYILREMDIVRITGPLERIFHLVYVEGLKTFTFVCEDEHPDENKTPSSHVSLFSGMLKRTVVSVYLDGAWQPITYQKLVVG